MASIHSFGVATLPVGTIIPWTTNTAPANSILCFGQAISRTTYIKLYNVIGTTYGIGDGSSTFNLPDLRARGIIGKDNMGGTSASRITGASTPNSSSVTWDETIGGTAGEETHVLTVAELAAHTHNITHLQNGGVVNAYDAGGVYINNTTGTTQSAGSNTAHNNIQPVMALNFVIIYQ